MLLSTAAKTRGMRHSFPLTLLLAIPLVAAACAVSTQQEVDMGNSYAGQIAQQMPLIRSAKGDGNPFRAGSPRPADAVDVGLGFHGRS